MTKLLQRNQPNLVVRARSVATDGEDGHSGRRGASSRPLLDGPFIETKELVVAHWPADAHARLAAKAGRYASVNGLRMYYEVHGDGAPLVVLHGALTTIESSFGAVLPKLASTHRVIAIEQQAHGHTTDIDRPASYAQMAADTVELLRQLDIRQADVLGYSMGASVAFELALRYPGIVRRLAIVAGCSNKSGYQPGLKNFMRSIDPTHEAWLNHPLGPTRKNVLERDFLRASRRREQWVAALTRTKEAFDSFRDLASDDLRSIAARTLFVGGNDGVIRPEHLHEISSIVPNARLELFPETNHGAMVPRAIEVVPAFFCADAPTARTRQCATVRT